MNIELLQKICSTFPSVIEDVKWGSNLCFCVGGKIFCIANLDMPHTFSFKVSDDEFDELSSTEGFAPAPYLARAKWVIVADTARLSNSDLKKYLQQSYELIKSKISKKTRLESGLN